MVNCDRDFSMGPSIFPAIDGIHYENWNSTLNKYPGENGLSSAEDWNRAWVIDFRGCWIDLVSVALFLFFSLSLYLFARMDNEEKNWDDGKKERKW